MAKLGEKLKAERINRGLTQSAMAEILGITRSAYSLYESGRREPNISTLTNIATVLNISLDELMGYTKLTDTERTQVIKKWFYNNEQKRADIIIEMLKTHGYQIEDGLFWLTVTDYQGFSFYVDKGDFREMVEHCDSDIRYNIEKLLNNSRPKDDNN